MVELKNDDTIWYNNISILYENNNIIDFIPSENMDYGEKLNAIVRLSIYIGLVFMLYYSNSIMLFIPIITMIISYLLYSSYEPNKDTDRLKEIIKQVGAGGLTPEEQNEILKQYTLDSSDKLCQKPTKDNPFMNVLLSDYVTQPNRPEACSYDLKSTRDEINATFNNGLYKNSFDIWENDNSQRQFFTNPSTTIPNDRDTFAKMLHNPNNICKDGDLNKCLKYEDERYVGVGNPLI